jgi:predicted phosphodiesterase
VRYLILSDIHANWEALQAVLARAAGDYDLILNCGDLVGYGPDPNAVVDWCRENNSLIVRGNHDKACVRLEELEWFNPVARASAVWTHNLLTPENKLFLSLLPMGPSPYSDFHVLHGSPADEDEYLVDLAEVREIVPYISRTLSFFGHTHLQGGFYVHRNGIRRIETDEIRIEDDAAYLINSGSVGQPRDGDWRAAYAIYSEHERQVDFYRAAYDVEETQRKIREAGLPEMLAYRLEMGV